MGNDFTCSHVNIPTPYFAHRVDSNTHINLVMNIWSVVRNLERGKVHGSIGIHLPHARNKLHRLSVFLVDPVNAGSRGAPGCTMQHEAWDVSKVVEPTGLRNELWSLGIKEVGGTLWEED